MKKLPAISVIIPTLNEADWIQDCLLPLQAWRRRGHEIIVVDGGSNDATVTHAESYADHVLNSPPGRAVQMNAGAAQASGQILLFLHADTYLAADADQHIINALKRKHDHLGTAWGRFDLTLSGKQYMFRIIERMISIRSRLTGIASGDQAIFVTHELFFSLGGYDDQPLMEDIAFSKKAKRHHQPVNLKSKAVTSSRRWEQSGILQTLLLMWALRLAYFIGIKPHYLARIYR